MFTASELQTPPANPDAEQIVNIAGKSFGLDELDSVIGQFFRGSAACFASLRIVDTVKGNEKLLVLVEHDRFWAQKRQLIPHATGWELGDIHFVPPHFITKTASGGIDRDKTLADWLACQSGSHAASRAYNEADTALEVAKLFPGILFDQPLQKQLNPLGRQFVKSFFEERGVHYDRKLTLESLSKGPAPSVKAPQTEIFSIVALVDGSRLGFGGPQHFIDETFLAAIAEVVGCPVHFEHICAPPTPILFSDLIFHDYHLPRNPNPAYAAVSSILTKIKTASLILIDDEDNFRTPSFCAYPLLDHQFKMEPDASLLGHRMQRYTQNHHLLPRRVILGRDLPPAKINPTLDGLEIYLQTPILRMAFHSMFRAHTEQWHFQDYRDFVSDAEKLTSPGWVERFRDTLIRFIREREGRFRQCLGDAQNRFVLVDMPHFCSFLLNPSAVDFVALQYNSFCIVGLPSSLPYLPQRLKELGKPYFFASEVNPADKNYDCILLTGGIGKMPATDKPTFDFVHTREEGKGGGRPHNVPESIDVLCPPLALCNEKLFRDLRDRGGVFIGNYLLNLAPSLTAEYRVN